MRLWRVSNHRSLSGEGGRFSGGRWHSRGRPVVYTAESSPLALLEALVHLDAEGLPEPYQLLRIEGPEGIAFADYDGDQPPPDQAKSAAWGDAWLAAGETALARVPAAVAPHACNWLLNPTHPDAARFAITASGRWPWDKRLLRR
jgi:RES domain-containing protein